MQIRLGEVSIFNGDSGSGVVEEKQSLAFYIGVPPSIHFEYPSDATGQRGQESLFSFNSTSTRTQMTHGDNQQRFLFQSIIGKGGIAYVYQALDRQSGRTVAVKRVVDAQDVEVTGHQDELRFLQLLHGHPRIIRLIAHYPIGGDYCMVLEYMPSTLCSYLNGHSRSAGITDDEANRRLSIAKQLAQALAYCHHNDVIHGDVSPNNVALSSEGQVKLIDFNHACLNDPMAFEYCQRGALSYRAPELLYSNEYQKGHILPSVDVWSYGCVMVELFSQSDRLVPWRHDTPMARTDVHRMLTSDDGEYLVRHQQKHPLIARSLQVTPSDRWTAEQLSLVE